MVTISGLNAVTGQDTAGPASSEDSRPTMKLIAEALSPAAPPAAGPFQAVASPVWPLLDALAPPVGAAESREPARGTLVQLFSGMAAPLPAAPPAFPAAAAFAPSAPMGGAMVMPLPAPPGAGPFPAPGLLPTPGPFPTHWAPPLAEPAAATPARLLPAEQVTASLADVFQGLGRAAAPGAVPGATRGSGAFAGLRLPGSGTGFR